MGLDGVEFIMAVEESFGIAIPDEVGSEQGQGCVEQRAFYRLRRASMQVFTQPRNAIRPATRWDDILPQRQRRHNWRLLHKTIGTPHWPRLTVFGRVPASVATIGGTAQFLVARGAAAFQRSTEGWSRQAVEDTITRLMHEQIGITTFRWDQEFVRDLGVD